MNTTVNPQSHAVTVSLKELLAGTDETHATQYHPKLFLIH